MKDLLKEAQLYFASRTEDFWHWADRYQVIEWRNGLSICYRQDLLSVLQALQPHGLPPLEVILLLLAACREKWQMTDFNYSFDRQEFVPILDFLKRIHALPAELRQGHQRVSLLQRLFSQYDPWLNAEDADFVVNEFASGRIPHEKFIAPRERESQWSVVSGILLPLTKIRNLETYIRTGRDNPLEAAPLREPEDLLAQLAQYPDTHGLARLTKRLIAALHIPPHTQGASDQPIGGVSDLSNRGDLDRLLLSELANDDDTLLARLANNEALYLRRENPPDPQVQQHVILVDVSLRQWGIPRVFGTAAALSFALNPQQGVSTKAYAVGDFLSAANALTTHREVVYFLEQFSRALDCRAGLQTFFRDNPQRQEQESIFFISSAEALADLNFSQFLAKYADRLDYLLVHERSGELFLYKLLNGNRRLLSNSKFDLEDLLFGAKVLGKPKHKNLIYPVVFSLPKFPLLFPFTRQVDRLCACSNGQAALALAPDRNVWLWVNPQWGALQILQGVPSDCQSWFWVNDKKYLFGLLQYESQALLFIYPPLAEQVYTIDLRKGEITTPKGLIKNASTRIEFEIQEAAEFYKHGDLIFIGKPHWHSEARCFRIVLDPKVDVQALRFNVSNYQALKSNHLPQNFKKIINSGYSVLCNIRYIGINAAGHLQVDQWAIRIIQEKLQLHEVSSLAPNPGFRIKFESVTDPEHTFQLKRAIWPNGAEAFVDNRGFLHLRSAQEEQPEICLSLVLRIALGAYASDGVHSGNAYFIPIDYQTVLEPTLFYQRYLQTFIHHLRTAS
jgi:hypothetical protein